MGIGSVVRRALGPLEPCVARGYRRAFFDMSAFARAVADRSPAVLLEVGCGEGAFAEAVMKALPELRYVGIDVCSEPGRLFSGDHGRAEFRSVAVEKFAEGNARRFDAVVVCDVLHHLPAASRIQFLRTAASMVRTGGTLIVKDWERRFSPVHLAAWLSDRVITGDAIQYESAAGLRALMSEVDPGLVLDGEHHFPPWPNNLALFLRAP